jgi:hypothetical protein
MRAAQKSSRKSKPCPAISRPNKALPRRLRRRPADRQSRARAWLATPGAKTAEPSGPDAAHLRAQDRVLKAEKFKRELHPFDGYERLKAQAANKEYPKPSDNCRWRFFGLFYVAPNQNSYMCRAAHAERHPRTLAVCRSR